ncbi:MAG: anthranilate synthase component I family protein [Micrococcales bacterium]|nr:anthranilate synthase component I family protein [Micrococcales bacterium]
MARGWVRHPLGRGFDPLAVHAALVGNATDSVLLDGGADEWSYVARGTRWVAPEPVLPALRERLAARAVAATGREEDAPRFHGGLVGWLAYELRGETTGVAVPERDGHPLAAFLEVDRLVAVHGRTGQAELHALGDAWDGELRRWRDDVTRRLREPAVVARAADPPPRPGAWRDGARRYLAGIAAAQEAIREGEAYQLCLTTSVVSELTPASPRPDPVELHRRLRETSPSHHGALLRIGAVDLISASPERFLAIRPDGRIQTSPIKGTRPRDADPVADSALAAELAASEKERAENLMIVDLMRNDLARVCRPGSVEVSRLLQVEGYAQVHQLVSTVRGRLAADRDAIDAVAALFPAGSMTGAPKRRATEILAGLEGAPRGLYAGAFGWFGADGDVELAMTIRSIVVDDDRITVGTGGGITALSDPVAELEETRVKAAPLLATLGIRP